MNSHKLGLYAVQCGTNMSLVSNIFDNVKETGFQCDYYRGNITVKESSFAQSKSRGIYILYGYHANETLNVDINNCSFTKNKAGIAALRYNYRHRHNPHYTHVKVKNSKFLQNEEMARLYLQSDNPNGGATFSFHNNTISQCQRGLIFEQNKFDHLIQWDIRNNTFQHGGNGSVFVLRGHGNITGNLITNWTYIGGSLVSLNHYTSKCRLHISDNLIHANKLVRDVMHLESRCMNVSFTNNTVTDNTITPYVMRFALFKDDMFKTDGIMANNVISKNRRLGACIVSSALVVGGYRKLQVTDNVFDNPDLSYEISITQPTLNESSRLDFSHNYMGSADSQIISSRISDGNDKRWTPIAHVMPYYTTSDKDAVSTEALVHNFIKGIVSEIGGILSDSQVIASRISDGNDKRWTPIAHVMPYYTTPDKDAVSTEAPVHKEIVIEIGGILEKSRSLSSNQMYLISSHLIIPTGITLTLAAGTHLQLLPSAGLYIKGKLNIMGEINNPVIIKKSALQPVQGICTGENVRLVGGTLQSEGRLEIYENGVWRTVCNRHWNWDDAHVACRQLGFVQGNCENNIILFFKIYPL